MHYSNGLVLSIQVKIQLDGLQSEHIVTVVAHVVENKTSFESRGVYRANREGNVDMQVDASLDGTYTGLVCLLFCFNVILNSPEQKTHRFWQHSRPMMYFI
ncbi:MAG: acyl-CoA thioesterase/BAAT N-terminal domain-containing protein [Sedimenticola sp.]